MEVYTLPSHETRQEHALRDLHDNSYSSQAAMVDHIRYHDARVPTPRKVLTFNSSPDQLPLSYRFLNSNSIDQYSSAKHFPQYPPQQICPVSSTRRKMPSARAAVALAALQDSNLAARNSPADRPTNVCYLQLHQDCVCLVLTHVPEIDGLTDKVGLGYDDRFLSKL